MSIEDLIETVVITTNDHAEWTVVEESVPDHTGRSVGILFPSKHGVIQLQVPG